MISSISLYVVSTEAILGIFVLYGVLIFLVTFLYFLAMRLLISSQNKKTIKRNRLIGTSNLVVASISIWVLISINYTSNIRIIMAISGIAMVLLSILALRKNDNSKNQYSMPVK